MYVVFLRSKLHKLVRSGCHDSANYHRRCYCCSYFSLLLLLMMMIMMPCDSARQPQSSCGSAWVLLGQIQESYDLGIYLTADSGYPNRCCSRAAACSFPVAVVFAAAISFRCCWSCCWGWCSLSSLAREVRGRLALREGTGHETVVVVI